MENSLCQAKSDRTAGGDFLCSPVMQQFFPANNRNPTVAAAGEICKLFVSLANWITNTHSSIAAVALLLTISGGAWFAPPQGTRNNPRRSPPHKSKNYHIFIPDRIARALFLYMYFGKTRDGLKLLLLCECRVVIPSAGDDKFIAHAPALPLKHQNGRSLLCVRAGK